MEKNELTTCINWMFKRNWTMLNSIVPLHYCESLYITYQFKQGIYCTEPFNANDLFKRIDEIRNENGNIIHIYPYKEITYLDERYPILFRQKKKWKPSL